MLNLYKSIMVYRSYHIIGVEEWKSGKVDRWSGKVEAPELYYIYIR